MPPVAPARSEALLWPKPQAATFGATTVVLPAVGKAFTIAAPAGQPSSSTLEAAFARYHAILYPTQQPLATATSEAGQPTVTSLVVTVDDVATPLGMGVSEAYNVSVPAGGGSAALHAATVWGALRGLETFAQLVQVDPASGSLLIADAPVDVQDAPRFQHRGLLVDTSRHYLPVDTLLHIVDALAANKLNVMHIHFTDAQSFPVQSASYPRLVLGAWSPRLTYSLADLTRLQDYAIARGIRIVPEFDVPGHAYAWGVGYPNITATCPGYSANINNIPLNPANPFALQVLGGFLGDMLKVFNDSLFHLGGDEVVYGCWAEDPSIQQWMAKMGFGTNYNDLMQYFVTRADSIVYDDHKTVVHWEEVFDDGIQVPPHTVFQVWKSHAVLGSIVKAGHRAILSNSNAWYLNCGFQPECAYISWQNVYMNEPFANLSLTAAEKALVLGGEAALWAGYTDHTNFDQQAWPRGSAVAERLWSAESVTNITDASWRLSYHRCRLVSRGIMASPMEVGYCPDMFP